MGTIKAKDNVPTLEFTKGYLRFRHSVKQNDGKTIVGIFCSDTKSEDIGVNVHPPADEVLDPILYILLEDPLQADAFSSAFSDAAKAMRLNPTDGGTENA